MMKRMNSLRDYDDDGRSFYRVDVGDDDGGDAMFRKRLRGPSGDAVIPRFLTTTTQEERLTWVQQLQQHQAYTQHETTSPSYRMIQDERNHSTAPSIMETSYGGSGRFATEHHHQQQIAIAMHQQQQQQTQQALYIAQQQQDELCIPHHPQQQYPQRLRASMETDGRFHRFHQGNNSLVSGSAGTNAQRVAMNSMRMMAHQQQPHAQNNGPSYNSHSMGISSGAPVMSSLTKNASNSLEDHHHLGRTNASSSLLREEYNMLLMEEKDCSTDDQVASSRILDASLRSALLEARWQQRLGFVNHRNSVLPVEPSPRHSLFSNNHGQFRSPTQSEHHGDLSFSNYPIMMGTTTFAPSREANVISAVSSLLDYHPNNANRAALNYQMNDGMPVTTNTSPNVDDGRSEGHLNQEARRLSSMMSSISPKKSCSPKTTEHTYQYDVGKVKELSLASDKGNLSDYQCLLREQIVLFAVTENDMQCSAQGRNKPISLGQVGVLCRHCARIPPGMRPSGAVYFPSKLSGLYQASQNMAINHFGKRCHSIPETTRTRLLQLKQHKSTVLGGGKHFWANGAKVMGIVEHESCLRFKEEPV